MSSLEVIEGIQQQSATEEIVYSITTTNWGSAPTTPVVIAYDMDTGTDVTATVFPTNTPTVAGDVITLSLLKALTRNRTYRIEVKFTSGGSIFECFFKVRCTI